jgi:hypothetical protein
MGDNKRTPCKSFSIIASGLEKDLEDQSRVEVGEYLDFIGGNKRA